LLTSIDDSVTARGHLAGGSAGTWNNIAVVGSIVANLTSAVDQTISAETMAELVAARGNLGVAFLTSIDKSITAIGKLAVGLASVGSIRVPGSVIALLTTVNDTITARWLLSVSSASVGSGVGVVEEPVVALLSEKRLDDTIVKGTVGELGNVEVELSEEGGRSTSVVEDGNSDKGASVSVGMEELSLEVGVDTVVGVLRGSVELNSDQSVASQDTSGINDKSQRPSSVNKVDG